MKDKVGARLILLRQNKEIVKNCHSSMVFALQNIQLEWHFLGIFEIAAGENNGRFSRKHSVKNFGRLVDAWRFLWILTIPFFQICYSRSSLLYCLLRSVCVWIASIGLGFGRFFILRRDRTESCKRQNSHWLCHHLVRQLPLCTIVILRGFLHSTPLSTKYSQGRISKTVYFPKKWFWL